MKILALRVATAFGLQFLGLLIVFLVLGILGVEKTPTWVYGTVGGCIFCFALAAQGVRSSEGGEQ